jgi:hypothetical protein
MATAWRATSGILVVAVHRSGVGGPNYHDTPQKNAFSHVHDALQYALLGSGESDVVMNRVARQRRSSGPRIADGVDYNPLDYEPAYGGSRRQSIPGQPGYRGSWR